MNKLYKTISIVAIMVILIVASIFVQVHAYEYTNDGVIKYVTDEHEMNGVKLQLTQTNALNLKAYFMDHPVSDENARIIIDNLELAREALEDSGVKTTSEVRAIPGLLEKVTGYIETACKAADLELKVDFDKEPIEVGIKHGADNIITQTSYFEVFGSNDLNNPTKPVDPNEPINPDDPNKPVNPDEPENPNKPINPVDPENPDKPNDSDDSTNNGNTGNNANNNNNNDSGNNSNNNANNTNTVSKGSTAKKLVYTGNDYSLIIRIIVAIVAVAIIGIAVKKYAK